MSPNDKSQPLDSRKVGSGEQPFQAFSRAYRLLTARDYARVFDRPFRSSDRYFTVLARPKENDAGVSRLGLAIAKKQLRHAVQRNRIKRIVREYFRTEVIPASGQSMDYVVMARAAVGSSDNCKLRRSLASHFGRLREQAPGENDTGRPVP